MPQTPDNSPGSPGHNENDEPLSPEAASALAKILHFAYGLVITPIEIIRHLSRKDAADLLEQADEDTNKK